MRSCFYIFPGIFPAVLTAYFHQIRQKHFCLFPWLYTKRCPLSDTGRQKQRRRQIHRTPSRYCRKPINCCTGVIIWLFTARILQERRILFANIHGRLIYTWKHGILKVSALIWQFVFPISLKRSVILLYSMACMKPQSLQHLTRYPI